MHDLILLDDNKKVHGQGLGFVLMVYPLLILAMLLFCSNAAAHAVSPVPKTGGTHCYKIVMAPDYTRTIVPCADTNQDGEFQSGIAWPSPRFTTIGATIRDNLTGLIWSKDSTPKLGQWVSAKQYIDTINSDGSLGGHTDWRMPNVRELYSLINLDKQGVDYKTWMESNGFTDVSTSSYWSSTRVTGGIYAQFFRVVPSYAKIEKSLLTLSCFLWPVRGGANGNPDPLYRSNVPKTGQKKCYAVIDSDSNYEIPCSGTGQDGELQWGINLPSVGERFCPCKDDNEILIGAIVDNLSGLMWLSNAQAIGIVLDWYTAIGDRLNSLNSGGMHGIGFYYGEFTDWRLINLQEQMSIIDWQTIAYPAGHPFRSVNKHVWTSNIDSIISINEVGYPFVFTEGYIMNKAPNTGIYNASYVRDAASYTLSISKTGAGTGTVRSTDNKMECNGSDPCADQDYLECNLVTLQAVPDAEWAFKGWEGACTGKGDCTIYMSENKSVTAIFSLDDCPDCSGPDVIIRDFTIEDGVNCNCSGQNITIGPNVTLQSGSTLTVDTDNLNIIPTVHFENGAQFNSNP